MASLLLECAIRAVLIAAGTALVLSIFRIRRPAVRHAAWTAVVMAMLALPIWALDGPKLALGVLQPAAPPPAAASLSETPVPAVRTAATTDATASHEAQTITQQPVARNWSRGVLVVYFIGLIALLARLIAGTIYAHDFRATAMLQDGRATSDRCASPITIGWFAPALILPSGWQTWPPAKLSAVLAHEREHARRRDPLVQWCALLNRALFWFHPLAWWLERRVAALAEESCDAAVLAAGHSPEDYSEYLLDFARTVAANRQRMRVVGMAMPGGGLRPRIRQILEGAPVAPMSRVRIGSTAVFCAASTALFAGATLAPRTPTPSSLSSASVRQSAGAIPKFDVVSVKPCDPKNPGSGGSRSGGAGSISPGRLIENCLTLTNLIQNAYLRFADGRGHSPWKTLDTPIEGGPEWIKHDPFLLEATVEGASRQEMMRGPMLQAVLEDRFHLKLHRETRQGPVYELTVAASGSKLTPAKEGVCVPPDWTVFPLPSLPNGQQQCGVKGGIVDGNGNKLMRPPGGSSYTMVWTDEAMSVDELATDLLHLDRPVINKTGINGLFSVRVTHTFDRTDPDDGSPIIDAHVAAAVLKEQLGLELKPSTGARDFLVIDHVERPTPNDPLSGASSMLGSQHR